MEVRSRRSLLLALTFVVAFCSIAYELVYSELLSVVFGGTVVRYSITIGLFLFSLGVGAFLYSRYDLSEAGFFKVELGLALAGPLGLVFIILLNSFVVPRPGGGSPLVSQGLVISSHVPIVVVGVLSGLEVPFLASMVETERNAFSEVLGADYVGSLAGTVGWALVLYPTFGLIPAVFVLGLLNALAALVFLVRFSPGGRVTLAACLLVVVAYGGVVVANEQVDDFLTRTYLGSGAQDVAAPGGVGDGRSSVDAAHRLRRSSPGARYSVGGRSDYVSRRPVRPQGGVGWLLVRHGVGGDDGVRARGVPPNYDGSVDLRP